tara:strand:- start:570 stop:743 length:174 start_codon:yes stop_codon:yes gene_type:complete
MKLTAGDPESWLATVWAALDEWGDEFSGVVIQARLDDVNTAMAWIRDDLGLDIKGDI